MKANKKDIFTLTTITTIAAIMLAFVFTSTRDQIELAQEKLRQEALSQVMPFMHSAYERKIFVFQNMEVPIYAVHENGELQGAALELTSKEGYSGNIVFLLGINKEEKITGLKIIKHAETPGLGAKAVLKKWWGQFLDKKKPEFHFKVKKDGGDVDSITASTITSRAIANSVDFGLDLFHEYLNNNSVKSQEEKKNGKQSESQNLKAKKRNFIKNIL